MNDRDRRRSGCQSAASGSGEGEVALSSLLLDRDAGEDRIDAVIVYGDNSIGADVVEAAAAKGLHVVVKADGGYLDK